MTGIDKLLSLYALGFFFFLFFSIGPGLFSLQALRPEEAFFDHH
jgi:hypothetical protein